MDPLDILTDLENVVPFFQPIFSADEHRVIGYEVLGRYISNHESYSLGPFFLDDQIPHEYKFEVDQLLLTKCLEKALNLDERIYLFLNRDAESLMVDNGEPFLNELLSFEKRGFHLNRIVLEISEQNYNGDLSQLDHLLQYYRTYGIKIAMAKMDNRGNLFNRIGELEPDILKINLRILKSISKGDAFTDVLYSLSLLARKIGAALLFENIEQDYQLQFAWKNGGRYFQGYFLAKPSPDFIHPNFMKEKLKENFHQFIFYEKKKLELVYAKADFFQVKVQDIVLKNKKANYEDLFQSLIKEMDQIAYRMYVCDEDGFQTSPNFFKGEKDWFIQKEYFHKNWSWRPYFLENIFKMRSEKKGILSDLYSDLETGETTRTFSFPINEKEFLFIDLSYQYLFEHDELL